MDEIEKLISRRGLLRGGLAFGAAMALFTPGVFAEQLAATPRLTEGPFYPDHLPLDQDNDLIIIGNSTTPAVASMCGSTWFPFCSSSSTLKWRFCSPGP